MTMEWITGVKLTTLPPDEIRDLVGVGQEAFLVQLLEVGFFHGDPHPGNLLKVGWVPLCVTHITHPFAHQVLTVSRGFPVSVALRRVGACVCCVTPTGHYVLVCGLCR